MYQACIALSADARWCLSATPFPNHTFEDAIAQVVFLRDPLVVAPVGEPRHGRIPRTTWRYALRHRGAQWNFFHPIARRLTLDSSIHGQRPVMIPEPQYDLLAVRLDPEEQQQYAEMLSTARIRAQGFGLEPSVALRDLRHHLSGGNPRLPPVDGRFTGATAGDMARLEEPCPVCFEEPTLPVRTACGHVFCNSCLSKWFGPHPIGSCPCCRRNLREQDVALFPTDTGGDNGDNGANGAANRGGSRIAAFDAYLASARLAGNEQRVLVFVDFTDVVPRLQERCAAQGIPCFLLTGSMSHGARTRALADFGSEPMAVFIMTTRSGAVGINLTAATRILLYEPVLSNAGEQQAIGRAVRIGQHRRVTVTRMVCVDTVEDGIIRRRDAGITFSSAVVRQVLAE